MHQQQMHKPLWHFFSSQPDCRRSICTPSTLKKQQLVLPQKLSLEQLTSEHCFSNCFCFWRFCELWMSWQNRYFSRWCTPLPHCYSVSIQQRCVNGRDERLRQSWSMRTSTLSAFGCQRSQLHAPFLQLILCHLQHSEDTLFIWKALRWHDLGEISQALFACL